MQNSLYSVYVTLYLVGPQDIVYINQSKEIHSIAIVSHSYCALDCVDQMLPYYNNSHTITDAQMAISPNMNYSFAFDAIV